MLAGAGFVPLTNFPAFTSYTSSATLAPFINTLYTYTIGIATILAVIEIIWGGFLWMGSGASVSNKETGRNKIVMSIFGLVLVLSPYIILSLINPGMLSLRLGTKNLTLKQNSAKKITPAKTSGCKRAGTSSKTVPIGGSSPTLEKFNCPGNFQGLGSKICPSTLTKHEVFYNGEYTDMVNNIVKNLYKSTTLYCYSDKGRTFNSYENVSLKGGLISFGPKTYFSDIMQSAYDDIAGSCKENGGIIKTSNSNLKKLKGTINGEYTTWLRNPKKGTRFTIGSPSVSCLAYPSIPSQPAGFPYTVGNICFKTTPICVPPPSSSQSETN